MTRPRRTDDAPTGYTIEELTAEAGISARAVRYYVTQGLLPRRARGYWFLHYEESFRQRLLAIVRLRAKGHHLGAIRQKVDAASAEELALFAGLMPPLADRATLYERWERIPLRLGLELHLRSDAQPAVVALARRIEADLAKLG